MRKKLAAWRRPTLTKRIADLLFCLLAASSGLAIGCSNNSDRQSISGTVTFEGQPLKKGVISFVPLAGTSSPTAGANIVDGQFAIPAEGGAFAGSFLVTIKAFRPTGKKIRDPMWDTMVDEYKQYLPSRYNSASEEEVNIQRGTANRFEFALASQ